MLGKSYSAVKRWQVNAQLLTTYWNIGRIIVEYEQQNAIQPGLLVFHPGSDQGSSIHVNTFFFWIPS